MPSSVENLNDKFGSPMQEKCQSLISLHNSILPLWKGMGVPTSRAPRGSTFVVGWSCSCWWIGLSFGIGSVRQVPIKSTLVLQKYNLHKKVQIKSKKNKLLFSKVLRNYAMISEKHFSKYHHCVFNFKISIKGASIA